MSYRDDDNNDGWGWGTNANGTSRQHPGHPSKEPDAGFCNPRKAKDWDEWKEANDRWKKGQ